MQHTGPTFPAAFDIVVPFHSKDAPVFWNHTLPGLLKHAAGLQTVYVVCSAQAWKDPGHPQVKFFDEARYPFSFQQVKEFLSNTSRAGWYYQQLLKLYAHIVIHDLMDNYVIWDSDTVLLRPTAFFHNDYGEIRALFAISPEYNPPYMEHMKRLLPCLERISGRWGGVTHHQPWMRPIMKKLFEDVQHRHGTSFWRAYLIQVEKKHYGGAGCADYEVVMAYALRFFGEHCLIRPLMWANRRELPNPDEGLDFVSLHEHMSPLVPASKV
jgi:hypothetical protein